MPTDGTDVKVGILILLWICVLVVALDHVGSNSGDHNLLKVEFFSRYIADNFFLIIFNWYYF